jgi:NH3-dependent NAD+ synthetase
MMDESGTRISVERQEYLKQQSAKHYIRIVNRTPTINLMPQNCKDDKYTGKQHELQDSLMTGWEDYLRTMFAKENSSQSEEMVDAVKNRQPRCRRDRQKVHRQLEQNQLPKYWTHY